MDTFYIIWQPYAPNNYLAVKHDTLDEAEKEAIRIATLERKPVHVMELRGTVRIEIKAVWEHPEKPRCPECNNRLDYCICRPAGCGCANLVCTCKPAKIDGRI